MVALRLFLLLLGIAINIIALRSAIRTLVLSRSARDPITGIVFRAMRWLFERWLRRRNSYLERDRIMAYYAPLSLMTVLPTWMAMVLVGFALMFWATGVETWFEAFSISGSSLLTLGYSHSTAPIHTAFEFIEATIGLMLIALLIAYLPTMYSAFSSRERAVTLLEIRAGSPPSAVEMILRYQRNEGMDELHESWKTWESWFAEIHESHTSLAALVFFRSPQPQHSWVTASGTVLDAASLLLACHDAPMDAQAALCIRAGYLALRSMADFFDFPYNPAPSYPEEPISITRTEFDEAYNQLEESGLPLVQDREQAWQDFAGWRVNYDAPLLALARLTMAPSAPWSSDRI
ncbi:MAG: hypothetical protein R3300_14735 [Candidatus Promineifilaceae bacterium]|nr:hypothetical protein [Candidatus Promineifilaceae bacterium]